MLHRTLGVTSIACALLLSAASAFADGYSEGKALYKSGNFPAALAKFQQATAERPKAAKVFWNLGLTQLKLHLGKQGADIPIRHTMQILRDAYARA